MCRKKKLVTASSLLHDAYPTFIHSRNVLQNLGVHSFASFFFLLIKKRKTRDYVLPAYFTVCKLNRGSSKSEGLFLLRDLFVMDEEEEMKMRWKQNEEKLQRMSFSCLLRRVLHSPNNLVTLHYFSSQQWKDRCILCILGTWQP